MHHRALLHVAPAADADRVVVGAQHGAEPDAGVLGELDLPTTCALSATHALAATRGTSSPSLYNAIANLLLALFAVPTILGTSPRLLALDVLRLADPGAKATQARARCSMRSADAAIDTDAVIAELPGFRAVRRDRVSCRPNRCRRARRSRPKGRPLHAIAHIEFNAINLALDAVWRFPACRGVLRRLAARRERGGAALRCCTSTCCRSATITATSTHDGLWTMAERNGGDVVARMGLVPARWRRGLDATPPLQAKFLTRRRRARGAILAIILRDEIGHVAIGNRWYHFPVCVRENDPVAHGATTGPAPRCADSEGPFNVEARIAAGFLE